MSDRLPDFLIIGAAKAGTTTLFRDLATHPDVFFPLHKEPHNLVEPSVMTDVGRAAYAKLFREARDNQMIAEASTGYTKLPRYQGVPERAKALLGPDLKVIYLVREPVSRTVSHHRHLYHDQRIAADLNQVLLSDDVLDRELIEIGRYATQIRPWIETLGADQVRVVQFERYIEQRREAVVALQEFVGLTPEPDRVDEASAFNVTQNRRYARGPIGKAITAVTSAGVWKHRVRGWVPDAVVAAGKRVLFRPPRPEPPALNAASVDRLIATFQPEAEALAGIMGVSGPLWDFEKVRLRHLPSPTSSN